MKYSDKTLAYYNNLQNIGELDDSDASVGSGIVGSPLCGDVMKLQIKFDEDDIIIDAKYKVFGCVSAISSMELTCSLLKGRTLEEAKLIENDNIADSLELTKIKRHCSVLAKEAIIAAIDDYIAKKNKTKKHLFKISEKAVSHVTDLIKSQGDGCIGIRIVVISGGCSGIDYSLAYQMENESEKLCEDCVNGIRIFYEEEDKLVVDGVEIDVMEDDFGIGFTITNKNQFNCCTNCTCNCGAK